MDASVSTSRQLEERWAKLEDQLTAHVEAEIESRAAQWRDYMVERQRELDGDCASMVEQITAGSKKTKQGFETLAENLKDLLAQSCRAGMARLTDLRVKAHISAEHGRQGEQAGRPDQRPVNRHRHVNNIGHDAPNRTT